MYLDHSHVVVYGGLFMHFSSGEPEQASHHIVTSLRRELGNEATLLVSLHCDGTHAFVLAWTKHSNVKYTIYKLNATLNRETFSSLQQSM